VLAVRCATNRIWKSIELTNSTEGNLRIHLHWLAGDIYWLRSIIIVATTSEIHGNIDGINNGCDVGDCDLDGVGDVMITRFGKHMRL
jgi:hypothetical protein